MKSCKRFLCTLLVVMLLTGLFSPVVSVHAASSAKLTAKGFELKLTDISNKKTNEASWVISKKIKDGSSKLDYYMISTGDIANLGPFGYERVVPSFLSDKDATPAICNDESNVVGMLTRVPSTFTMTKNNILGVTKFGRYTTFNNKTYVLMNFSNKELTLEGSKDKILLGKGSDRSMFRTYVLKTGEHTMGGTSYDVVQPSDYIFAIINPNDADATSNYGKLLSELQLASENVKAPEESDDDKQSQTDIKGDKEDQAADANDIATFQYGILKPYYGIDSNDVASGKVSPICGVSTTKGGTSLSDVYYNVTAGKASKEELFGDSATVSGVTDEDKLLRQIASNIGHGLYLNQVPGSEKTETYLAKFPLYTTTTAVLNLSSNADQVVSEANSKIDQIRASKSIDDTSTYTGRALTHKQRLDAFYLSAYSAQTAAMSIKEQDWYTQYNGSDLPERWTPKALEIDGKLFYCGLQFDDSGVAGALPLNEDSFVGLTGVLNEWGTYGTTYRVYISGKTPTTSTFDSLQNLKDTYDAYGTKFKVIDTMWKYKEDASEKSLEELYEEANKANAVGKLKNDYQLDAGQPLTMFFNVDSLGQSISKASTNWLNNDTPEGTYLEISDNIKKGIQQSATYIPMQTNVYSVDTLLKCDEDFLRDFHYKYGFMRKALYKADSSTAAIDYYVTGATPSSTEVCTLKDFINNEEDIVLYLDGGFYNMQELSETVASRNEATSSWTAGALKDLAEYIEETKGFDPLTMVKSSPITAAYMEKTYGISDISSMSTDELEDKLSELRTTQTLEKTNERLSHLYKSEPYNTYDDAARLAIVTALGNYKKEAEPNTLLRDNVDNVVLKSSAIDDYLDCVTVREEFASEEDTTGYQYTTYDEYTPMLSAAYTSAVYRDVNVYNLLSETTETPVFIASDKLIGISDASVKMKNSIFNYALMRNLKSQTQMNYAYSLDMNSPLYMDVYGNILTESGYVVIPAASNATLFNYTYNERPISMGLYLVYGNDYRIPASVIGENTNILGNMFVLDEELQVFKVNGRADTNSAGDTIYWNKLDSYDEDTTQVAKDACGQFISVKTNVNWVAMSNVISEVMRGAPLDHIDKQAENLITTESTVTLRAATKLERLLESLKSNQVNSLITIPNFTTMEQYDYIVAFLFKLLMVAVSVIIIIAIYRDATSGQLNFNTFLKTLWACVLVFASVASIPALFQFSYYGANKALLQSEAQSIVLYNTEKYESGIEVGVTETSTTTRSDDIMVQLDWLQIPWYEQLDALLFGNSSRAVDIVRREALLESDVAQQSDVTVYNDGIYMSTQDIFDSVGLDYTFTGSDAENRGLYMYNNKEEDGLTTTKTFSFYSPYYAFLTALTDNVNTYNAENSTYKYTTKYMSGSRLKTVGLCEAYFKSAYFMEDSTDVLRLHEITGIPGQYQEYSDSLFTEEEIAKMQNCLWYTNPLDVDGTDKRVAQMNKYARDYIAQNKDLLNKISDETFIKSMALAMALEYNKVWGVSAANSYELFNLDSTEILRLSLADRETAMMASPMSYARYVHDYGGEAGVYAAALLSMVIWLGSFIKPACVMLAYFSVFLSLFVFKVCMHRKENSIQGYVITVTLLCATNMLHALLLKIGLWLPTLGLGTLPCIIFMLLIQIAYMFVLGLVTSIALRDWQGLGEYKYKESFEALRSKVTGNTTSAVMSGRVKHHTNNWDYYNDLQQQHRRRNV